MLNSNVFSYVCHSKPIINLAVILLENVKFYLQHVSYRVNGYPVNQNETPLEKSLFVPSLPTLLRHVCFSNVKNCYEMMKIHFT